MGFRRYDRGRRREPQQRVNHRIRVPEIRVIGAEGERLGVKATRDALRKAQDLGLDLVEINPKASPPVCKILDYGKYKYDESKRKRETKRKQSVTEVKEVKLRPKTDDHDLDFKSRAARKFIEAGNKVKFTVRFRGREITHPQKAREQLEWILKQLEEISNVEVRPSMEGRTMTMIIAPKPFVMQDLANSKAEAERERKEAELARRASKGKKSKPGASRPGASDAGMSDPGMSDPGASDPGASDPGEASEPGRSSRKGKAANGSADSKPKRSSKGKEGKQARSSKESAGKSSAGKSSAGKSSAKAEAKKDGGKDAEASKSEKGAKGKGKSSGRAKAKADQPTK